MAKNKSIKDSVKTVSGFISNKEKTEKKFDEVVIGDTAFEDPTAGGEYDNALGTIIFKGSYTEIMASKFHMLMTDITEDDSEVELLQEYDWVIVDENQYGYTLFNYSCDPCGCVTYNN